MTLPTLHVGRGTRRRGLTLFPVWHELVPGPPVRLAGPGSLSVRELTVPQVPFLQVAVAGKTPVLLLDGELLIGGQHCCTHR